MRTRTHSLSRRSPLARAAGLLGAAAAAATLLTSCSAGDGDAAPDGSITGTITLQTWALTPKFTDYLTGVANDFEKAHSGAKITLVDQPGDGYAEKVLSQAAAGSLPDVINLPPDIALPLAKRGFLTDIATGSGDLKKTYVAGALDAYEYKGLDGVYGYPWYLNTDVNYWNATRFTACGLDPANPPTTTDELFEQAATMHTACPSDYLMSRKPGLADFTLAGLDVLNADGTAFVFADAPKAVELLERYTAAYTNGLLPPSVLNSDYLGNSTLFTQGKVAWTTGGATSLAAFEENNPSLKGNVTVSAALDTPPLYVQGVSVSAVSKHPATARAFAEFLTNATNQEAFAHLVNIFPSTVSSQSDPFFSKDDGTTNGEARVLANEALKTAENLTPVQANSAMTTALDQQIALAMKGDVSAKEALKTAQAKMNSLLANG